MTDMDRAGGEREREAFAAYITSQENIGFDAVVWRGIGRDPLGVVYEPQYSENSLRSEWAAWQASAALSREPREGGYVPKAVDVLARLRASHMREQKHGTVETSSAAYNKRLGAEWTLRMIGLADAIDQEHALAHPPAPAGGARAEPYVPKCGDVFGWEWETDAEAEAEYVRVAVGGDRWVGVSDGGISHGMRDEPVGKGARYLRPATPAERAAAGVREEGAASESGGRFVTCEQASCSTQGVTRSAGPWRCAIHHQEHPANAHPSHDAGGVGEAKAAFYERALKFVAAYKAYADAIGNGLPRKGTDVVWADKEQHAKCIDLLIAYDALLAAEARRGESGEAIDAQGGRE